MLEKKVMWPHEVVYSNRGKPAVYEELFLSLFVKGYLITMKGEEGATKDKMVTNLEDLMEDLELYGWQKLRAYHSVWPHNWKTKPSFPFAGPSFGIWPPQMQHLSLPQPHQAPGGVLKVGSCTTLWPGLAHRPARLSTKGAAQMPQHTRTSSIHVAAGLATVGRTLPHKERDYNRKHFCRWLLTVFQPLFTFQPLFNECHLSWRQGHTGVPHACCSVLLWLQSWNL